MEAPAVIETHSFTVFSKHASRPVAGQVLAVAILTDVPDTAEIDRPRFTHLAIDCANQAATGQGETFHHGDFIITTDPTAIGASSFDNGHRCPTCDEGRAVALDALAEHDNCIVLMGHVYFAGPDPTTN